MNKVELLAPAKDLNKAKVAIDYGADAVYVGGKNFSLRSRASNFSIEDLIELKEYAKKHNVKVYVTTNIIFHDDDFVGIKEYLKTLEKIGIDGIILSSLSLLSICKDVAPKLERHISTQLSTNNSNTINVLKIWGADRVVLAREASIDNIEDIKYKTDLPLEVFIHGGMCSNYSGRCTLSNRMTIRDANRGGCAHSCRWKYKIFDNGELISKEDCPLSMSSKDLRAVEFIPKLLDMGIASLKIEGRMKSEYYIAQVVKTYRSLIDEYYEKKEINKERLEYYKNELIKAENRPSDDGFLSGNMNNEKNLYGINGAGVTHDYVAYVKAYDERRSLALIEVKNKFNLGDKLEIFGPEIDNYIFENALMFDIDWNLVTSANKPTELLYLRSPIPLKKGDMIRMVHENDN